MSRSGFIEADYCDRDAVLAFGRTRAKVASATRGKRGQAFLRLALKSLDQMEDKRLAGGTFGVGADGCMCLMSSIATETGRATALDTDHEWDGEGACQRLAEAFNVAPILIQDLVWENDEVAPLDPSERWAFMRRHIQRAVKEETK